MASIIPGIDEYKRAVADRNAILQEARRLAEIVAKGLEILKQDPATWRFGEPASVWDSRNDDGITIDDPPPEPISPTTWPHVGALMGLQQRYQKAVDAERAAIAALPSYLKEPGVLKALLAAYTKKS